jgi:hypothetical protein
MIITAPICFVDASAQFNREQTPVKIQGKWYHTVNKRGGRSDGSVFYQDRDNFLVDMIRVPCLGADTSLIVRGYDYQKTRKGAPLVPARIEIFNTGAGGVLQERLVKIDCHTIMQAE